MSCFVASLNPQPRRFGGWEEYYGRICCWPGRRACLHVDRKLMLAWLQGL